MVAAVGLGLASCQRYLGKRVKPACASSTKDLQCSKLATTDWNFKVSRLDVRLVKSVFRT